MKDINEEPTDDEIAEMWANARVAEHNDPKFLNLKEFGLKVFEVKGIGEKFTPPNKFANKINVNKAKGTFRVNNAETPSSRYLTVKIKHWANIEEYEGRMATVLVPEKTWHAIINISNRLKRLGIKQPNNIIYWKKHMWIYWVCMVTDEKLEELKPFLRAWDVKDKNLWKEFDSMCYWDGTNRTSTYTKPGMQEYFIKFYKDQEK